MIDIFTILKNANSIGGIDITELTDVLINGNTQVYDIAMIGKGKMILKNKEDNKFVKLDCICSYFDTDDITDCNDLKNTHTSGCSTCKDCFACMLRKLETGETSLK